MTLRSISQILRSRSPRHRRPPQVALRCGPSPPGDPAFLALGAGLVPVAAVTSSPGGPASDLWGISVHGVSSTEGRVDSTETAPPSTETSSTCAEKGLHDQPALLEPATY